MKIFTPLSAVLLAFSLSACSGLVAPSNAAEPAAEPDAPAAHAQSTGESCITPGRWHDTRAGASLSTPEAVERMAAQNVVLLGETHVVADHHRWHMQTVAQLYAQRPDMILGFESFPRRIQPVLDKWVAGELTEAEFIKQSEWETVWRYDPDLYLPLFHFARINRVPMVALNVDRSLMGEVSRLGWAGVPKERRRGVGDPATPNPAYIDMLGRVYGQHGDGEGGTNGAPSAPGLNDPDFANFVDVQVAWDRAMAEAAAQALQSAQAEGRNPLFVGIIGRGHLDFDHGVPHQLEDLGVKRVLVATPWDKLRRCEALQHSPPPADLAFGLQTTPDYMPQDDDGPLLGVMIEAIEDAEGVRVGRVVDGSVAEAAGIKTDDVIERAAGQAIKTTGDLIAIVKSMPPGTWLPLSVRRGSETLDIVARFPAEES